MSHIHQSVCGTPGIQQYEQATRTTLHYGCLSSHHPPQSKLTSGGQLVTFVPPTPCFPQNQKQITSNENHVTFPSAAALPHGKDRQLPWPEGQQGLSLSPLSQVPIRSKGSLLSWKARWTPVPLQGLMPPMGDAP